MAKEPETKKHSLGPLTITGESIRRLERLTQETYLADNRPWVIGFSGGKDSTAIVQLVWDALSKLTPEQLTKPIYVISGDTLVEAPAIVRRIQNTHDRIREVARKQGLPFKTAVVRPLLSDTFWVNLLGKGYPAPYERFRWCTDRMKIQPANLFIKTTVAEFGEVVLVLGVRRAESATREQSMNLHRRHGEALSRHSDLTSAWVYTPIEDWTTNDVWTFLQQNPSPWGDNNRDLVAMYKNASGECPLVVDTQTPSCGNSRFGCWVCTVVNQDHSMEAQIENGEYWMEPLLRFRDRLAETQDPKNKAEIRDVRRRDGKVHLWGQKTKRCPKCGDEGFLKGNFCKKCKAKLGVTVKLKSLGVKESEKRKLIWGPYKLEFRKQLLRELLKTQEMVCKEGPDNTQPLISMGELQEIRRLWRTESGDWDDSVPNIWKEVTGDDSAWVQDDSVVGSGSELQLLTKIADRHGVNPRLVTELLDFERGMVGLHKGKQITARLDKIFRKDWRTDEAIFNEIAAREEEILPEAEQEDVSAS